MLINDSVTGNGENQIHISENTVNLRNPGEDHQTRPEQRPKHLDLEPRQLPWLHQVPYFKKRKGEESGLQLERRTFLFGPRKKVEGLIRRSGGFLLSAGEAVSGRRRVATLIFIFLHLLLLPAFFHQNLQVCQEMQSSEEGNSA